VIELNKLYNENCLDTMKKMEDNSVDAIVTDPPYGLSFMGKKWDYDVPSVEIWQKCLRVLKPGGYLLAFAGTRTQHRMAVRIEDAGFEIRDLIAWVYGSGFPKSLNIGKAIDKLQGNERELIKERIMTQGGGNSLQMRMGEKKEVEANITKGTSEWEGWGTALKPALEPITVARKPLSEKTVAENCLKWGVGGINIDGCRVGSDGEHKRPFVERKTKDSGEWEIKSGIVKPFQPTNAEGRFPANFIHDGSGEVTSLFPQSKSTGGTKSIKQNQGSSEFNDSSAGANPYYNFGDSGSASRFFYCAKASRSERNEGCEELEEGQTVGGGGMNNTEDDVCGKYGSIKAPAKNFHPTVKPISLMEYLVKLVSRSGAVIFDPFTGSGSTLIACVNLGRSFIGAELSAEYCEIANKRIAEAQKQQNLF
jgi:DNA modification methylase